MLTQDGHGAPHPYSKREQGRRLLWFLCRIFLFHTVPRQVRGWHARLLRLFGAQVGAGGTIHSSARIAMPWNLKMGDHCVLGERVELYNLGPVTIGNHTVISQRAVLCAGSHDYTIRTMPLLRLPIVIGSGCWICAEAFVGPNVTVGDGTVVGARSVVTRSLPPHMVCAGNPCRPLKERRIKDDD
ncbi:MAG: WcaF family extracellular polysaccharide biosynthesis acetyltransferase [Planctomycetales bacterium]|nr:WcaF family extracellular polysaccharide biosynthesis acetyltransferase [Planctomycetales bacterium]